MDSVIREICLFIITNIDDEITMEKLENTFYYNRFYLIRVFKSYTGYTIKEFINNVKVLKTVEPLIFTDDTILKIALSNGFNSQEYYSEKFKDVIGISPLRFRKEFENIDAIDDINVLKEKRDYLVYLKQYEQQLLDMSNVLNNSNEVQKIRKISN